MKAKLNSYQGIFQPYCFPCFDILFVCAELKWYRVSVSSSNDISSKSGSKSASTGPNTVKNALGGKECHTADDPAAAITPDLVYSVNFVRTFVRR